MSSRVVPGKSNSNEAATQVEDLKARVDRCVIDALDAYAADESVTRSEAVDSILTDWLRTHGHKITTATKPTGPATDAVAAMDAAIAKDRRSKKR